MDAIIFNPANIRSVDAARNVVMTLIIVNHTPEVLPSGAVDHVIKDSALIGKMHIESLAKLMNYRSKISIFISALAKRKRANILMMLKISLHSTRYDSN